MVETSASMAQLIKSSSEDLKGTAASQGSGSNKRYKVVLPVSNTATPLSTSSSTGTVTPASLDGKEILSTTPKASWTPIKSFKYTLQQPVPPSVQEKKAVNSDVKSSSAQETQTSAAPSIDQTALVQSISTLTSTLNQTNGFLVNFAKTMAQNFGEEAGMGLGKEASSTIKTPVEKAPAPKVEKKVRHDANCDACNKNIVGNRYKCE